MPTLGFTRADFDIFKLEGFDERMQQILGRVRPRLVRLGNDLAPELARKLHLEFFPHVARHARRTVNPPPETWAAFGPSPKGYKRYGYLALCISGFGIHARAVVKSEADNRVEMGRRLANQAAELTRSFKGTSVARYDRWNFERLPAPIPATDESLVRSRPGAREENRRPGSGLRMAGRRRAQGRSRRVRGRFPRARAALPRPALGGVGAGS